MKSFMLSVWCCLLLLPAFNPAAAASDILISGSARFECNLLSKYMKKHGYYFVKEVRYNNKFKTNLFAAKYADVIIKNKDNATLGVGRTDKEGKFSIPVAQDSSYQLLVRFHGRKIENTVTFSDTKNIIVNVGYFDTEKIDDWLQIPAISYCYACDIRYLEKKESL